MNSPCFIIAEIGLNHNGEFDLACRSVEAAAACGVDAVKFQNWKTEDFLADRSILYTYKSRGESITEPLFDICKRAEFQDEWLPPLKSLCDRLGVMFMSTPTSESGVTLLLNNGVTVLKNGSDYLTNIPLLSFMGRTGLKIILSTGMAHAEDIDDAVDCIRKSGNNDIVLLHCTSNYPTLEKDVNLARMISLKGRYQLPVGFSDHTIGYHAAVQAVTLGACVIEKHFTLDKDLVGPDHWFSTNPDEMKQYVTEIRAAENRIGDHSITPADSEAQIRDEYRLGVVAIREIPLGSILKEGDVAFMKPCRGLLPKEIGAFYGRELLVSLKKGDPVKKDYFKP